MSYMNLFKPSARENDCGRIIARSLHQSGISVVKIEIVSSLRAPFFPLNTWIYNIDIS